MQNPAPGACERPNTPGSHRSVPRSIPRSIPRCQVTAENDVAGFYARRIESLRASHRVAAQQWRRLANLRLVVFVLAAASVWWLVDAGPGMRAIPAAALVITLVLFAYLVTRSTRARTRVTRLADLVLINEAGVHRVRREWAALEQRPWSDVPISHPYAYDLDVFGSASLAQLFPGVSAAPGRTTLASWLLAPAPVDDLRRRQEAVAELKNRIEWRDELVLHTRRITTSAERLHAFVDWADREDWPANDGWVFAAAIALPIALVLLAAAQATGVISGAYWLIPIALGGSLTARYKTPLKVALGQVQGQRNMLKGYATVTQLVSGESFESDALRSIQSDLTEDADAAGRMRALERLADCADVRLSPMLHFAVQGLTLWDFHIAYLLARWKRGTGKHIGGWLGAIGVVESLVALATLAHDNPDWAFPEVGTREPAIMSATALGHPLLPESSRVANDVTVGPERTLLFVTGSNMAGKSTLLRAIGLNVVLAQAGSVVCAEAMACPPVLLYTSMRVQDSLARGVSYFMAELERLKLIVDAAEAVKESHQQKLMYLLDEILHGTNSAERLIAARHVLVRLMDLGAIGAVTTHDLQLADASVLEHAAQHVHFQEVFSRTADGRATMSFDYKLRPGKATSSNALKLLELVGLTRDGEIS
jgi:hypothetical protein